MSPGACAIFYPPRETFLAAVQEALADQPHIQAKLCTDGRRVAWLPRRPAGWWPINTLIVKEAA